MKTVGIMQPYFFPYVGHFALIKNTDSWIVFDPTDYVRKSWMNRNRILKPEPAEGAQYFSVPVVKAPRGTPISEIVVKNTEDWGALVIRQMEHYKKTAPYYTQVVEFLEDCFQSRPDRLAPLCAEYLKKTCEYIGIDFKAQIFSEMGLEIEPPTHPGEWALNICKALGDIDRYINPPSGRPIFDPAQWDEIGVELRFLETELKEYDQKRATFEPGLSIVDVMMFNTPEQIREMLNQVTVTS